MVNPNELIHLIIKSPDLSLALAEVNSRTAGFFGNVEAHAEGEKIDNCMPATFCHVTMPNGTHYGRVAIHPDYETLWPAGLYSNFEIMADYPAWLTEVPIKEIDTTTTVPIMETVSVDTGQVDAEGFPIYETVTQQKTVTEDLYDTEGVVIMEKVVPVTKDIHTYKIVGYEPVEPYPNREPYNCGSITDDEGNTSDVMLGGW